MSCNNKLTQAQQGFVPVASTLGSWMDHRKAGEISLQNQIGCAGEKRWPEGAFFRMQEHKEGSFQGIPKATVLLPEAGRGTSSRFSHLWCWSMGPPSSPVLQG